MARLGRISKKNRVGALALLCAALSFLGAPLGCTSVPEGGSVSIPPAAAADKDFEQVLGKWHKTVRVYDQLQNRIELHAVLFSEEMRQAFIARWKRVRGDTEVRIAQEFGGKLAFFVSLYTPDESFMSLDNQNLWSIKMRFGDEVLAPTSVLRLYEKPMYQSFFDFIDKWSAEYLVVFDVSDVEAAESVTLPQSLSAQFYSSLSYIDLQWR